MNSAVYDQHHEGDILEQLWVAKNRLMRSSSTYRRKAKLEKITVLYSASEYLTGNIGRKHFEAILAKNPRYCHSFFRSKTKILIEKVLAASPDAFHGRTGSGYFL